MFKLHKQFPLAVAFVLLLARILSGRSGQQDLKARRARAMDKLGPDTIAIFWSAPTARVFQRRQLRVSAGQQPALPDGIDQEDTILVLMPGNAAKREVLFVREADARREHWNGHSLTPAEASAASGIETVLTANQFEPFVAGILGPARARRSAARRSEDVSSRPSRRARPTSRCCSSRSAR